MRPGKGKSKGSAFERAVAKELSLWLTDGKDGKQLIRTVLSGGWRRGQTRGDFRQVGDLAPNGPRGEAFRSKFAVECKHHRRIDLLCLWTKEKSGLVLWWNKLRQECKASGVRPILIWRTNGRPIMVCMENLPPGVTEHAYFCKQKMYVFSFEELQVNVQPAQLGV